MEGKVEAERVTGSCYCGAVAFEVTPPARFCAHCHCQNCRRAHGAAFVTWIGFKAEQVHITSGREYLTRYLTETGATRSFCRTCGSTLFYEGPRWAGEVHIALANLHGDIGKRPGGHVYVDHKASWWEINDDLPRYGGPSGMEPKEGG
jgi:hypothetical protein